MQSPAGAATSAAAFDLPTLARALPSGFGVLASRGAWRPAPHLDLLTRKLVDLEQRRITRLLVECPPRHGKSNLCSCYFPAWYLGRHPDHQVILASYEASFAQFWGERARDALAEYGPQTFGVGVHQRRNRASDWLLTKGVGRMRVTGVAGGITGRGADLLIIDDPIKDAIEANSETYRLRTWDWYTSTARTRLEPHGIIVVIQTRWHQEDLIGRLRMQEVLGGERWESLTLPALVDTDDLATVDPLGRRVGEALWPARYDATALATIKQEIPAYWWNALYQQRPTPPGGDLAKTQWFPVVHALPVGHYRYCRFWDLGGSEVKQRAKDPDWTVGAKLARHLGDGRIFVVDIVRVRVSSGDAQNIMVQTAHLDGPGVPIREEQEPGSAGLAIINARKKALAGFNYAGRKPLGKPEGWTPMLIQAEVGNIALLVGAWNQRFLAEVADAPHGSHDDQLDAVSGAFKELTAGSGIAAGTWLAVGGAESERRGALPRRIF